MVFAMVGGFGTQFHIGMQFHVMTLGLGYFYSYFEEYPTFGAHSFRLSHFGPWFEGSWLLAHGLMPLVHILRTLLQQPKGPLLHTYA